MNQGKTKYLFTQAWGRVPLKYSVEDVSLSSAVMSGLLVDTAFYLEERVMPIDLDSSRIDPITILATLTIETFKPWSR